MKALQILFVSILVLPLGRDTRGADTAITQKCPIPFSYKFEQSAASPVHTSYLLRLDYVPKTEEEITAACVLIRNGQIAGHFPLRLQRARKEKWIRFSVGCLANDLAEGARIELYVRDAETEKQQTFSLALKDANKK